MIKSLSKTGHGGRWINLWNVCVNINGQDKHWTFASRKDPPEIHEDGSKQADAVIIVPITKDDKIVMNREFRLPLNRHEYSFPAGLIEANETPETAARRELMEETGLKIEDIAKVSPKLYSSSGLTDESVVILTCLVDGEISNKNHESDEMIETILVDREMAQKIIQGKDGSAISAKAWPMLMFMMVAAGCDK